MQPELGSYARVILLHAATGINGIIADCRVRDRRGGAEWLVRVPVSFAKSLGIEPHALARAMADRELPLRVATRWPITGTHLGFGHFGEPTGAPVGVMGMSPSCVTHGRGDHRVPGH